MRNVIAAIALAAGALAVSAAPVQAGTKTEIGTILGGIAGGLAGNQFGGGNGRVAMTGVGMVLGAIGGRSIGQSLDRADEVYEQQQRQTPVYRPLPVYETAPSYRRDTDRVDNLWQAHQQRDALPAVRIDPGLYRRNVPPVVNAGASDECRTFENTLVIDGRIETAQGTVCRQADGAWRIVSQQ